MEIKPRNQSRSWSRTEKMAGSQSRTDFTSTLLLGGNEFHTLGDAKENIDWDLATFKLVTVGV